MRARWLAAIVLAATWAPDAIAAAPQLHLCGVEHVEPLEGGVAVYFMSFALISDSSGTHRISPSPLAGQPAVRDAYPLKVGERLYTWNSPEDSCTVTAQTGGVLASAAVNFPVAGANPVKNFIPIDANPDFTSTHICWIKRVDQTKDGVKIYFNGTRYIHGPAGEIIVNSEPGPLDKFYKSTSNDKFHNLNDIADLCEMQKVRLGKLSGIEAHVRLVGPKQEVLLDKTEFIPASSLVRSHSNVNP